MRLKNREKGLSILELAISVALIALIIIFILGMYSTFFTSGVKLNDETIANFLGQSYINLYSVYANSDNENLRRQVRLLVDISNPKTQTYGAQYGILSSRFVGKKNFIIEVAGRTIYQGDISDKILVIVGVYWFTERVQNRKGSLIRGYGRTGITLRKVLNLPK